jgi:hypothetical protein
VSAATDRGVDEVSELWGASVDAWLGCGGDKADPEQVEGRYLDDEVFVGIQVGDAGRASR